MTEKELITKRNADSMLVPLRQFFHQHGHAHVPKLADYANVFDLCSRLRGMKAILPPKICKELDKMGFIWRINLSNDLKWYYNFGELKSFYKQHGHTRVPLRKPPYNSLGSWVLRQRRDEKRLTKEHKRMLTGIGFEWSDDIRQKKDKEWKQMFDKLLKFYKRNGHSNVPDRYGSDEKLGRWVSTVRYSQGRLEPWKSKLLRTVGFKSSDDIRKMREDNRTLLFKKIERYFTKYGHANVPESYVDSKLAIAIAYLRQYPTRISDAERKKLKQWNFLFSDQIKLKWEKLWDHSYDKLTKFKHRFGHCRVSSAYKDQQLARWVANQRKDEQEGRLPETRKKRLSSIGFSFYKDIAAMHEDTWLAMYDKLLKFKKKFGTTVVKEGYRDSKLAYWVQHQRQARNKMKDSRKMLLDKIHFTWSLR